MFGAQDRCLEKKPNQTIESLNPLLNKRCSLEASIGELQFKSETVLEKNLKGYLLISNVSHINSQIA